MVGCLDSSIQLRVHMVHRVLDIRQRFHIYPFEAMKLAHDLKSLSLTIVLLDALGAFKVLSAAGAWSYSQIKMFCYLERS